MGVTIIGTYIFLAIFCNPIVTRHDKAEEKFYADPYDYPSVVQLRLPDLTGIVEMEGTLIQQNWIITAAHGLNSVESNQKIIILDSVSVLDFLRTVKDYK